MPDFKSANQLIVDAIRNHSTPALPTHVSKGKRKYDFLKNGERVVYLIMEGDFLLKTYEKDKIIGFITYPTVIGMINSAMKNTYLERVDYGVIKSLPLSRFLRVITAQDLQPQLLSVIERQYCEVLTQMTYFKGSAGEDIPFIIKGMRQLPYSIRSRYSLLYLIENSTHYSRRTISRALVELRESGLIELKKGYLK